MVDHLVIFKWKPEATPEQIDAVTTALRGLKDLIPGIVDLSAGPNFSDRAQGFGTGLWVRFVDRDALNAYGPHPAHQSVVQNLILPLRTDVIVVDYDIASRAG